MEENKQIKLEAFKLHSNVYFIGSEAVSVHLIDTECGLVLIDTGYPNMGELILSNIKKLGFDPKNITAIFHSHGHIDHFGNTEMLAELSGAKTYISRIDNDIVNGTYDLSWAKELRLARLPFFSCDVLVEDGDTFNFGNTTVRCVHTPGHTDGVMSFIITLADGKIAAMHGGSFCMSDEGKLLYIGFTELPNETYYLVTQTGNHITFGGKRILLR